jgi:peptide alpha-N-acetyltransferase
MRTRLVSCLADNAPRTYVTDNHQIALETEIDNTASLRLYQKLGFLRTKRLHRYYLNGNTAFRLLLYLKKGVAAIPTSAPADYGMPAEYDELDYI